MKICLHYRAAPNVFAIATFDLFTDDCNITTPATQGSATPAATLVGCVAHPSGRTQTAWFFIRSTKVRWFSDVDKVLLVETAVSNGRWCHQARRGLRMMMLDCRQHGQSSGSYGTPAAHVVWSTRRNFHGQSVQRLISPKSGLIRYWS